MKALRYASLALALAGTACPQEPVRINNIPGRTAQSLNGKWRVIVDPYEYGLYDSKMRVKTGDAFFLNQKAKDKSQRVEYDFDNAQQLNVPGDWNSQDPRLFFYEGNVWYRQLFDHEQKPGTRSFLHFGAVNYQASVWLNGKKLGDHTGGFTPFDFEITGKTVPNGNFVILKVDNTRHKEGVPTTNSDWWNYGGLTAGVSVVTEPASFIEDYLVQLKKGSSSQIEGWVRINGAKRSQRVTLRIPDAKLELSVTTDASGYAALSVTANLALWSPENPRLYDVTLSAETDTVHDQIGFRTIAVSGTDILLNGKPVFLRGVSLQAEAPLRGGRAYSENDAHILLGWAKELGCNYIRLAHYPHSDAMIREADRMGLLVWSETPVYWTIDWQNPATLANARNQITESIARDRNRASIILWSIANETPVSPARNEFLGNLAAHVRASDSTRLVTAAMQYETQSKTEPGVNLARLADPLGDVLDVLAYNEYIGWYEGTPERIDLTTWSSSSHKPLIISEFGADGLYGMHGDARTRWSEEYQEDVFRRQLAMLERIPFLRGMSPWVLMDFRSPRRLLPNITDYFNRKGLLTLQGEKKKAWFVMQDFYRRKATN